LLYPENLSSQISIDEVSVSQGELYTFVTSKLGRGKKRTIIASIKGTKAKDIINVLSKIPEASRNQVKEVTLDMAKNMESSIKNSFLKADIVTDRFHVVKLVIDALQHIRIKHRWAEIDQENKMLSLAKKEGLQYSQRLLSNGDSFKQLLARSRYILAKNSKTWTKNQEERSVLLFREFPVLKKAYNHVMCFRNIYENQSKEKARQQFEDWIIKSESLGINEFNSSANSIKYHLVNILNFFNNRNTNANAESFNAKIKLFRANQRGVVDTKFFLFRLQKLFA
jgi:transposase|tara:strand:+ start:592 stop:1437 length:846 start_codon:yes stop_codon:yes gene_type:complete